MDQDLITLTHVCRGWRDMFTSRSLLWTRLNFTSVEKTRTHIQRSHSSPLHLYLIGGTTIDDAFSLVIPHIHRLKSLTILSNGLPRILRHFCRQTPLLEKLDIIVIGEAALDGTLFNEDLSSLRELRLHGVTTDLPWKNLANLQAVNLNFRLHRYETTQILDFLESAPLLHTVSLAYLMPESSDAPHERIIRLSHLKTFTISTRSTRSILLPHLHIPIGASLTSEFHFAGGQGSPLLDYLPGNSPNFSNLSHITRINLLFNPAWKYVKLSGPSGSLRVSFLWRDPSSSKNRQILHSLSHPLCSKIERLAISEYRHSGTAGGCPIFQILSSMNHLRTLILTDCVHLPFTRALDPEQNISDLVLCLNMKEFTFYVDSFIPSDIDHLVKMAKNRALRGAKLSSFTFVDTSGGKQRGEVFKLREYVTHLQYRINGEPPSWDYNPGE